MLPAHAEALTVKIRQTWSTGGPSELVWNEELAELDAGRAGTALARLRRTEDRCPSIHRFYEAYRLVQTETSHPYQRPRCATCDGNRWTETGRVAVRCPDCTVAGTRNPSPDKPADPAYVDALLAERTRRHDTGTAAADRWTDQFFESWHHERLDGQW